MATPHYGFQTISDSQSIDIVNAVNTPVTQIDTALHDSPYPGKRTYVLLGDSLGTGIHPDSSSSTGYSSSDYGWLNWCANHPTANTTVITNTSRVRTGNSGFTSSRDWLTEITARVEDGDIPDPTQVTDIVVMGGTNDISSSVSSIQTAITEFMNYVKATFPKADVWIGLLTAIQDNSNYTNLLDGYTTGAYNAGAHLLQQSANTFYLKSQISTDGIHLTEASYQATCNALRELVFNKHMSLTISEGKPVSNFVTLKSGVTLSSAANQRFYCNYNVDGIANVQYSMNIGNVPYIQYDSTTWPSESTIIPLFTLNNSIFNVPFSSWKYEVTINARNANAVHIPFNGCVFFNPTDNTFNLTQVSSLYNYDSSVSMSHMKIYVPTQIFTFAI